MKSKEAIEARVAYLLECITRDRTERDKCTNQAAWWNVDRRMKVRLREVEALRWVLTPEA